jgi:hypothetical protein
MSYVTVDVDILKPDTGALQIERPTHSHTPTSRGSTSERHSSSSGALTPEESRHPYAEPVSEGEEDEEMDLAPGTYDFFDYQISTCIVCSSSRSTHF